MASSVKQRKKAKVSITSGKAHIQASFNNTLVYITDLEGNTLSWATAGGMGFKGSRKSTPYAAQQAASKAGQAAKDNYNMRYIEIYVKGPGPGREAAARALSNCFDKVLFISDVTGIPFNGVRAEKERRV
jgi:small subunit ribosomal protein S11